MYAVVGCSDCTMLWIVEGRPETSQCPRCGSSRQYAKRKKFVSTENEDHAREVRASMLANRQDEGEAFAKLDSFAEMNAQIDEVGPSDAEYLEGSGLDPDAVAEAGERAAGGQRTLSRKERVLEAIRSCDEATTDTVVAAASERDVDPEFTRKTLEKLVRAGEATENRGVYRLL